MSQYSLTLINSSELPAPKFAVFAQLPSAATFDVFHVAWMARQLDQGNSTTFTWDMQWGFAWSARGVGLNYTWQGNRTMDADPNSAQKCAANFSYDGDWKLDYSPRTPSGGRLWIQSDGTVPTPSEQASSLAVTLNGNAVSAVGTGPNLNQTFLTHPTYYIDAGNYVPGLMVDATVLTGFQQISYNGGATSVTWELLADNTWQQH